MIKALEKLLYIRYIVGQNEKLNSRQLNSQIETGYFAVSRLSLQIFGFFIWLILFSGRKR